MFKDFRDFVLRGNVLDLAIGIIIGVAFGAIVNSFVKDVIMPPIGVLLGNTDFSNLFVVIRQGATVPGPYASLADAQLAGAATLNYGLFINTIISFIIVAFAVFMIVRVFNKARQAMEKKQETVAPTIKDCPFCATAIPIKATRCPHCTSEIK